MNLPKFKEWMLKKVAEEAGEIWNNLSNADIVFGRTGAKSKNVSQNKSDQNKSDQKKIDPERLFFGLSKKSD